MMQKLTVTETKYFTNSDYNKSPGEIFNAKIKEKGLVDKSNISGFIDTFDLENCNTSNKAEWRPKQDNKVKIQGF